MIRRDAEVRRSRFDHRHHGSQNTANSTDLLPVVVLCGGNREEVAEQLVGAVDQMSVHQVNSKCLLLRAAHGTREQVRKLQVRPPATRLESRYRQAWIEPGLSHDVSG